MASIFEVIEGLTVTKEDITEAETFAEQYLSAQFPTYDFRQGTALRDMTVRPNATLLALLNKAVVEYFDDTDLINVSNDTSNEAVDKRMSNFFITRKSGDKSVIAARLFFTFPTGIPITTIIPVSAYFSVDNETKFYPKGNITVYSEATENEFYFRFDASSDQWYVDIELEAESPSEDADIETGDLLYFTIFSPYFLRATVQYLVSKSILEETNEEMLDRSYSSISTRNLINTPSIIARIGDQFNYVKSVYPVGLGHDWLFRDLIDIQDITDPSVVHTYHRGGHTDVYLETDPIVQTAQLSAVEDPATPGNHAFYVTGPIYNISRALTAPAGLEDDTMPVFIDSNSPTPEFTPFTFEVDGGSPYDSESIPTIPSLDTGLSAEQVIKITPTFAVPAGTTATFSFNVFQGVGSVNDNLESIDERVICADYLARSFQPVFLDINVDTRGVPVADQSIPYDAIQDHIASIPNGGSIYVTDIIRILTQNGVTDFALPLDVQAVTYNRYSEGNQDGSTSFTSELVTDTKNILEIQKFFLRDIKYNEASI